MAIYNEIFVGRFNRFLQKLLGMKGQSPTPQLSGEIIPTFPFLFGNEVGYLEGWELFGRGHDQTAGGVGTLAAIRFRNPVGSNVLVSILKYTIREISNSAQSSTLNVGTSGVDLAIGVPLDFTSIDRRTRPTPTAVMSAESLAAPGPLTNSAFIDRQFLPAGVIRELIVTPKQELPLVPGGALQLNSSTGNVSLGVTIWWKERFLEESERT